MVTETAKIGKEMKPEKVGGFIRNTYRKTMDASEQLSLTAVNLPFIFLEGVGVPAEKTERLKNFNTRFVTGVYRGADKVFGAPFSWFGGDVGKPTGGKREAKPPKKVAKKAAPKAAKKSAEKKAAPKKSPKKAPSKVPKKAVKAKKEPPKVAAKKPAPVAAATKKAA